MSSKLYMGFQNKDMNTFQQFTKSDWIIIDTYFSSKVDIGYTNHLNNMVLR